MQKKNKSVQFTTDKKLLSLPKVKIIKENIIVYLEFIINTNN